VILIKTNSKKYSFIYEEQKLQQHSETLITYDRVIERDLSRGSNHCHIYYKERSNKFEKKGSDLFYSSRHQCLLLYLKKIILNC
jgi:hypothetical protein